MTGIEIKLTGPLFDGRAPVMATRIVSDIADRVAAFALEAWQHNLDGSIQHPTPYYETQVRIEKTGVTDRSVNDRGVIYGPWLEGTGSRNRTTRFKGYSSLRKARQSTIAAVPRLAEDAVKRLVQELS